MTNRRLAPMCQHLVDHVQPALQPYFQLCRLSNHTPGDCEDQAQRPTAETSTDSITPASVESTTDVFKPITTSDAKDSDTKRSSSSSTPQCDVRPSSSSSSSSIGHRTEHTYTRAGDDASGTVLKREDALFDEADDTSTSSSSPVLITGHTQPVTSCQLAADTHVVTSSMDGTVKLWNRTGNELVSVDCSSPVYKAVCVADRDRDASVSQLSILAGTESGNLVVCHVTVNRDDSVEVTGKKQLPLHVPNPLTALAVSDDQRHLVTGCCYSAFDFVHLNKPASSCRPRLDRRTRGTVKTWNGMPFRASQSDPELTVTCSRNTCQLTSSMTSERVGGYGVTCLALCGDSSLLAVCLSNVAPRPSSSSSAASSAAVVVVCDRDKLETLWLADDLSCTTVHDAVFHSQPPNSWSLFVSTDTAVNQLMTTGVNTFN